MGVPVQSLDNKVACSLPSFCTCLAQVCHVEDFTCLIADGQRCAIGNEGQSRQLSFALDRDLLGLRLVFSRTSRQVNDYKRLVLSVSNCARIVKTGCKLASRRVRHHLAKRVAHLFCFCAEHSKLSKSGQIGHDFTLINYGQRCSPTLIIKLGQVE